MAEGAVFAGRYRVARCVAAGAMGAVYEVAHTETGRRHALKVMHPHLFHNDEMRERFRREARIAAQLASEHIVDVSDAGIDEATKAPFLVMELLEGEDLGQRIKRSGPLSPSEVVTYLQQVALALDKTHAKSIVHRDLKPENLFLTRREGGLPRVKILDFGVAKVVAEGASGSGATRSLGTPLYMAPEQFRVGLKLAPTADIYALGMTAYTLLVGEPYWGAEARAAGDVIAFAMTVIRGPNESAVQRAAARGVVLPQAFDVWFSRATAVSPEQRYQSASEALRALGQVFHAVPRPKTAVLEPPRQGAGAARTTAPVPAMVAPAPPVPTTPPATMDQAAPPQTPAMPAGRAPVAQGLASTGQRSAPPLLAAGMGPLSTSTRDSAPSLPSVAVAPTSLGTGALEHISASTGATVGPVATPASRSRAPIFAGVALLGVTILGVGGWLGIRSVNNAAPSAGAPAGTSTAVTVPVATTPVEVPASTATPSAPATLSPPEPPTASAARPALTGALPAAAKPTAKPSASPTSPPSTKSTAAPLNLIGRD